MKLTEETDTTSRLPRVRGKRLAYILIVILVLWVAIGYLATMPIVGNHPFWRRMRARPQDFVLNAQDVSFLSTDGIPLRAWFIAAEGTPHATVILAHGIDGNRSDMLPRAWFLFRNHYNTLVVDLRAHGDSGGNYATPGYMEAFDIQGAISYLRRSRAEHGPIIVFGHSYGAVAALYAASQSTDVSAIIADSAFISFENMMRRATTLLAQDPERSYWDRLGLRLAGSRAAEWVVIPIYYLRTGVWPSREKADALLAIPEIKCPILFIAGASDRICPPENTLLMYDAARNPKKGLLIVPNADHDSTYAKAPHLYEATVVRFLDNVLPQ